MMSNAEVAAGVTLGAKCYIFVCCGCSQLAVSHRSDAMTCSTACRMRAHRSGALRRRRAKAKADHISPAIIGHAEAAARLLPPDLYARLRRGKAELWDVDIRAEMYRAFMALVFEDVEASAAEDWLIQVIKAANEQRLRFLTERPCNYHAALVDLFEHAETFAIVWPSPASPIRFDVMVTKGAPMVGVVDALLVKDRAEAEAVAKLLT